MLNWIVLFYHSICILFQLDSEDKTGDYQCLAQYGASVVASVPGRITISTVQDFPAQSDTVTTVSAGNTIIWWCDLPYSNPPAYVDYYKGGNFVKPKHNIQKVSSLIIPNVSEHDSGIYKCKVNILGENRESRAALSLKVVNSNSFREAPRFLRPPKKIYVAVKGMLYTANYYGNGMGFNRHRRGYNISFREGHFLCNFNYTPANSF